ncbi:outer membrane beta-barrel protein [Rheinheimera sp. UJ63]|uniref:outer membrane beta-barrel protein n=1 Tax=Rheinheimera sp. UJ63 TaxID=2910157 RepID=UPI001F3BBE10|nr:outer membrane beta-barrel protein [Rheinheimera sp. UJ63]MCF4010670.1 porin family protein [Rheinheimera sp. UJ63]
MKKTLLVVVLASVCGAANANVNNTYDFVDVGFAGVKVDDSDSTFNGFSLAASKLITDNVFVTGQLAKVEDSGADSVEIYDWDVNLLKVSVGYRYGIAPATDLYGQVGYARQKDTYNAVISNQRFSLSDTADGYLVKVGLKHSFGKFEGGVYAEHSDFGGDYDSATFVGVEGRLKFTDHFHGVVSYEQDSDVAMYKIAVSYAF